jgi:hypothetical protein
MADPRHGAVWNARINITTKTENPQREQNRLNARLVADCHSMNTVTNCVTLNVLLGKFTNVLKKDMPISYRCTNFL